MALKLEYSLPKNKIGDYWRILSIANNFEDNEVVVHVGLFEDEKKAELKCDPIYVLTITDFKGENNPFSLKELNKSKSNPKSIGYNALKQLEYPINFSVAEDV